MGVDVGGSTDAMDEDTTEEAKPQRRIKAKKAEKANIEVSLFSYQFTTFSLWLNSSRAPRSHKNLAHDTVLI
jgi:hypothetical protein